MLDLRGVISGSKTMDDVRDRVAKAEGKQYFDAFRKDIRDFIAVERDLMTGRALMANIAAALSVLVIIGGVIFSVKVSIRRSTETAGAIAGSVDRVVDSLVDSSSKSQCSFQDDYRGEPCLGIWRKPAGRQY